jgi:Zn-dependent peptidase ImmA (M78 family)
MTKKISFKIGGCTYKIKMQKDLVRNMNLFGMCNTADNTITVDSNVSIDRLEQTIVHELLHALLTESGYVPDEQEEELVERLGITLHQFLRENFALSTVLDDKGVYEARYEENEDEEL